MGFKWLIVPAALAAAGYYYIGPELGAPRTDPVATVLPDQTPAPALERVQRKSNAEPEVEVSVRKGQPSPSRSRSRPRRSTSTPSEPSRTSDRVPTNDG